MRLRIAEGRELLEPASPDDRGLDCAIHEAAAPKAPHRPTESTYQAFQAAYDHFNRELFGGSLPCCLITLQRRGRRTLGYYWAERFGEIGGSDRTAELAINPQYFLHRPMRETLSTFVHEMTAGNSIMASPRGAVTTTRNGPRR